MTAADIWTLVGIFGAFAAAAGAYVIRDRHVFKTIGDGDRRNAEAISQSSEKLHDRMNRVRDEYVKRSDMDGHIKHLEQSVEQGRHEFNHSITQLRHDFEKSQEQLRQDQRDHSVDMNKRFDNLVALLSSKKK